MKKINLLCNAHLDPVWLWRWNEGAAEAVSTFRVAADFCEQYDGFIFNHNEAVLYEWVEEYEPELFERIKKLVKAGKWRIMGGWYLQPDCIMPSGESFIRQIRVGREYFKEKFGVEPTTAINFDPFGHTRGLVQILKKTGYDSYAIMRPGKIKYGDFIWKGFDGSEVICQLIYGGYNTLKGKALEKIKNFITEYPELENSLIPWGIGDHGGGPSKKDLEDINDFIESNKDYEIKHSCCEDYFKRVDVSGLETVEESLVHCMVGCYTSMVRIKQMHRQVENKLGMCEKMLCHSKVSFDREKLLQAEKALLLSEFHDILPGSMVKKSEDDSLRLLNYADEILDRYTAKAFFALCGGQKPAKQGEIPVLVYNPHPYAVEKEFEVEFQLEDQNWNENETTVISVRDEKGNHLPSQNEKEDCTFSLDWRKKAVFRAKLEPMCINRFDCELRPVLNYKKIADFMQDENHIILTNDLMKVKINKKTGLIDQYNVKGSDLLSAGSGAINVYKDNEDPWGMRVDSFAEKCGVFDALSDYEANEFNGYKDETCPNVRVIENGNVRTKVQVIMKHSKSYAVVTYTVPKNDIYIDVNVKMLTNDVNKMFKYTLDTKVDNGKFIGQTAFGKEELLKENKEIAFQKWCGLCAEDKQVYVINKGTYGGSAYENIINISLLRTPVYSAHPIGQRKLAPTDRNLDHIDVGERNFEFRITANISNIEYEAEVFNQLPYILSFFPSGNGIKSDILMKLDNNAVIVSAIKEYNGKVMLRLYNSSGFEEKAVVEILNIKLKINFGKFEVKTFTIEENKIKETVMLGNVINP